MLEYLISEEYRWTRSRFTQEHWDTIVSQCCSSNSISQIRNKFDRFFLDTIQHDEIFYDLKNQRYFVVKLDNPDCELSNLQYKLFDGTSFVYYSYILFCPSYKRFIPISLIDDFQDQCINYYERK